jgi:uncharacterized protein
LVNLIKFEMIVAISGASGFIGKYIIKKFIAHASQIILLKREDDDNIWRSALTSADVIINMAGSPISNRWNIKTKREILESRVQTTRRIVQILNELPETGEQKLLITASASGIYPDDKFTRFDEFSSEKGSGFLADVVTRWEVEADNLVNPLVRLVITRLGVVLGKNGGVLKRMIPIFRIGIGGIFGSGKQITSFIHIDDVFNAFLFFIKNPKTSGLYNLVTPYPVTAIEFSRTLAKKLHRPLLFRIPAFIIRMAYGEASGIILNGVNVYPNQLLQQGFKFKYASLDEALDEVLS